MSYLDLKKWRIFGMLDSQFISMIHMAFVHGNLGSEAVIVTKDGMVYTLGSDTRGCVGISNKPGSLQPKKVEEMCEKDIKTFACGKGTNMLALTENGEVYSWVHNNVIEVGIRSINLGSTTDRMEMNLNKKFVVDIACGSHHSLVLTVDGEVYAWGQNNYGQLGSCIGISVNRPIKVHCALAGKKVVCISCGDTSSVAVTDRGEVYSWGHNGLGQLGSGNYKDELSPIKINTLIGIVIEKVVCGYMHVLALSDKGVLYVWGANSYGQLGLGTTTHVWSPKKLKVPEMGRVLDVATSQCNNISVAMGESNKVFMWGQCLGCCVTTPTLTPSKSVYDALAYYASPAVMHRPIVLHDEDEMRLEASLRAAFDDPTTGDLTIQVQGKPIHVHKVVLKMRSEYFRTMFQEHWTENNQSVIEHNQFSYEVYRAFLKYLYTDEIDLPLVNVLELQVLANIYIEEQLKRRCVQLIEKHLTDENVVFFYSTAIEYSAKEVEECCLKFALNHMTAVVKSTNFANLDETILKIFIIKVAQAGVFKT